MSDLKAHEKKIFETLFDRGGYVLDFTNQTFAEFFREHSVNIEDDKYFYNGDSKMKRLRAFWEIEPNNIVARILNGLLEYACTIDNVDKEKNVRAKDIIARLLGERSTPSSPLTEEDFLRQSYNDTSWSRVNMEAHLQPIIKQRMIEIQRCLSAKAFLSVILLCGSTLEGLLLSIASQTPQSFNQAKAAPKTNDNKPRPFNEWSLQSFIDVAFEVGIICLDIKKYSHSLRYFRNYIHPFEQARNSFIPSIHTAKISYQVLKAAIDQIIKYQQRG